MALFGQRWTAKPPRGTLIDRSHPLVGPASMQAFWALNEGTGGQAGDALRNYNLTGAGTSTTAWRNGPSGSGLYSSGMTRPVCTIPPAACALPTTLMFAGRFVSAPGNFSQFFGTGDLSAASSICNLGVYGSNIGCGHPNGSSVGNYTSTAALPSVGVDFVLGYSLGPTVGNLYLNGVLYATFSTSSINPTISGVYTIGFNVFNGPCNTLFYWGGYWSSFLSASAHQQLGSSPNAVWQIMQPARNFALFGQFPAIAATTGQQTPILSVSYAPPSTTGTYYAPLCDNKAPLASSHWDSSAANVWQPCPVSGGGTLDYLLVNTVNSAGGSYQFTIMKSSGGVVSATGLSTTPAATTGSDLTHLATFAQGDLWCMRCVTASGASSAGTVSWQTRFTAPGSNQSLVLGGYYGVGGGYPKNSATDYGSLQGCAGVGMGANGPFELQPCAGTYKNLYAYVPTAVTTGSWTVTYESGAAGSVTGTSLAATITSGNTGSDTTHSVAATAGQFIGTVLTPASTPTAQTAIFWGVEFDPAINGQSIGTYDITPVAGPLTVYNGVSGSDDDTSGAQNTTQNVIMGGVIVSRLYLANAVPTSSAAVAGTIMRNGVATSIAATIAISGSLASDLSDHIVTSDFDLLGVQTAYAGTGSIYPAMGVVFAYASATRVRRTLFGRSGSRGIG